MNGMTSRPPRAHTTGGEVSLAPPGIEVQYFLEIEPARAHSIQIPARSNTVTSSALRRLGLKHVEEEQDDYVIADIYAPPGRKRMSWCLEMGSLV